MKGVINQWLNQNAHVQGVLGGAVRCSEEMLMLPSSSAGVTPQNLENALRCVADTFQILERNRLPIGHLRWVYEHALLWCVRRTDGVILALLTHKDPQGVDMEGLGKMLDEFSTIGAPPLHI